MVAYLHASIEVTDPVAYERYRQEVPALIARHGGRYLARGGATEVLEGDAITARQVIIEFPDMAHLKAFYTDPDYRPLIPVRQGASRRCRLVAIEGV